jgi:hypothetical protein
MLCLTVYTYQHYQRIARLSATVLHTLRMEAAESSEMVTAIYPTTRKGNPHDINIHRLGGGGSENKVLKRMLRPEREEVRGC